MEVIKNELENEREMELEQEYIVLAIPTDSVEITITAKIFHKGELHTVKSRMGLREIRDAVKEAEEGYIPSDALFSLTPLGKEMAEKLQEKYRGEEDAD